jgi:hypothetical protein
VLGSDSPRARAFDNARLTDPHRLFALRAHGDGSFGLMTSARLP